MATTATGSAYRRFLRNYEQRKPSSMPLPEGLKADSIYLAFLRGAGATESQAWNTALRNMQQLRAQFTQSRSNVRATGKEERQNITDAALTRNTFRSGQRLQDLAKQRGRQTRNLNAMDVDYASRLSGVQTGLDERLADLTRARHEQVGDLTERAESRVQQQKIADVNLLGALAANQQGGAALQWLQGVGQPPPPPDDPWARLAAASPEQVAALSGLPKPTAAGARRANQPRGGIY